MITTIALAYLDAAFGTAFNANWLYLGTILVDLAVLQVIEEKL